MLAVPLASQPLIQALAELVDRHAECMARAEELVGAMSGGDFTKVQAAVAAQTAAFRTAEEAEAHRRQAEAALVRALGGAQRPVPGRLTTTALATLLPEAEAREVRRLRGELLYILVRLQALQQHGGVLARSALATMRREVGQEASTGYGATGEQHQAAERPRQHAGRSA